MKVNISKNTETIEEMNIEFPIYSLIEGDDETIYVKIDRDYKFTQIKTTWTTITLHTHKMHKNSPISYIWIKNKSDKEVWNEQLRVTKKHLDNF